MAYDAVAFSDDVYLFPAGGKPKGEGQTVPESGGGVPGQRNLAWSQLELRLMGMSPWSGCHMGDRIPEASISVEGGKSAGDRNLPGTGMGSLSVCYPCGCRSAVAETVCGRVHGNVRGNLQSAAAG